MIIHYFNPETDYALAAGDTTYNMPLKIRQLKERMCLTPARFASSGDIMAVDHLPSDSMIEDDIREIMKQKRLTILDISDIPAFCKENSESSIEFRPWGWNHSLLHRLKNLGIPKNLLKSKEEIDQVRRLSHRRTSIYFQSKLSTLLPEMEIQLAREFYDTNEAIDFLHYIGDAFFKLPWSSSGRGVIRASDFSEVKIREWIHGGIRKQGSVLAEVAYDKSLDFATEWWCRNGKAEFKGVSLFSATSSGRYVSNEIAPQRILFEKIKESAPAFNDKVINAQSLAIDEIISPYYSGPLGIDMLASKDGRIAPCVEINLRMTMGQAAIQQ